MRVVSRALCVMLVGVACGRAEKDAGQASGGDSASGGSVASGGSAESGGRATSGGANSGGFVFTDGGAPPMGGQTPSAGAGQGGAPSAGQGGASLPKGGSQSATGAAPGSGGSIASAGAGGAVAGNGGASIAGSAGGGGDGGARASCDDYLACGCGCCESPESTPLRCIYPEVAGDREAVVAADRALGMNPSCVSAGCSVGTRYACCRSLSPDSQPATYAASMSFGGYNRVHVSKQGAESCERIVLMSPDNIAPRIRTALELPTGWQWESAWHGSCFQSATTDTAIGVRGTVKLKPLGDGCALDVHLTVFYLAQSALTPIRFDVDDLVVAQLPPSECD